MSPITLLLLAVLLVWTIFSFRRTQNRQKEESANMRRNLVKGAVVETIGGLIATIDEVDQENKRYVLDAEGIYLTFTERAIYKIVSRPDEETTVEDADEPFQTSDVDQPSEDDTQVIEEN